MIREQEALRQASLDQCASYHQAEPLLCAVLPPIRLPLK